MSKQLGALTGSSAAGSPAASPVPARVASTSTVARQRRPDSPHPFLRPQGGTFQFPPSPLHSVGVLHATPTSPQGWTAHHPSGFQTTTKPSAISSGNRTTPSLNSSATCSSSLKPRGIPTQATCGGTSPAEVCTLYTAGGPFTTPLASDHPQSLHADLQETAWPTEWRYRHQAPDATPGDAHPVQRTSTPRATFKSLLTAAATMDARTRTPLERFVGGTRRSGLLSVPTCKVRFEDRRPAGKQPRTQRSNGRGNQQSRAQAQRAPKIQWEDMQIRLRIHEQMCARLCWVLASPAATFQHKVAQTQHLLSSSRRLFVELRKLKKRDDATLKAQCQRH